MSDRLIPTEPRDGGNRTLQVECLDLHRPLAETVQDDAS